MSTQWFYIASGWLRKSKRIGPLSDAELLLQIDKGQIEPETLVQSSKTRNKWIPMSKIGPAMEHWKRAHPESTESTAK
ncbi:DUF4339 domain-containing protein [Stieleria sp. TO1_6]|uniref:DUF4339 domain-containing protein n=1 Tax=Stieleria tagensis TaxID=2956795 RepID=UPI00209B39A9|nr:DUF4339 domain-containing protein [Stieleria tagensis]MCO8123907.1 DUF4339 domain-containing protein [Stieleria tagensis]